MAKISDPNLIAQLNNLKSSGNSGNNGIGDIIRKSLFQNLIGIGKNVANSVTSGLPEQSNQYASGIAEGVPQALTTAGRGIEQLLGRNNIPELNLPDSENNVQNIGRLISKGGTYGLMTAPFIAGAENVLPAAISPLLRNLIGSGAAGATLSPGSIQDRLSGALEFAAPAALLHAGKALGAFTKDTIAKSLRKVTPEKTYQSIIDAYDKSKAKLGNIFDFVRQQANERGIQNVGPLDSEILNNAKEYGFNTKSFNRMLDKAQKGNYQDVRDFYSELGRQERLALKSKNYEKAEGLRELQDNINEHLANHFENTGQKDLSLWLTAARHGYAKLKDLFEPTKNSMLRNLVGEERQIPGSFEPLLANRTSINKLKQNLPEVNKDIETYKAKQRLAEALKKAKKGLAYGAGLKLLSKGIHAHRED